MATAVLLARAHDDHHDAEFTAEQARAGVLIYVNRRQPEKAFAFAEYALEHYGRDLELNLVHLDLAEAEGMTEIAASFYADGPLLDENTPLSWLIRGRLAAPGAEEGACYEQALTLEPTFAAAHTAKGAAAFRRGDLSEARAEVDAALRLDPGDRRALSLRGRINLTEGRLAAAKNDLEEATGAGGYDPEGLAALAGLYRAAGEKDRARDVLRAAVAQRPSYGLYYYELASVLEELGEYDAASLTYAAAAARTSDEELAEKAAAAAARLAGRVTAEESL